MACEWVASTQFTAVKRTILQFYKQKYIQISKISL